MTHREIKPCSRCGGTVVTVTLKGTDYEVCGDMSCDFARTPEGLQFQRLADSKRLVKMHNARLTLTSTNAAR